ncbi:hypothetical protein BGZ99_003852 [Dissophora globulifera]|uniref:Uncharacterized protein n=1 Tax=Dissophora globulifera TaxID=979702 RepID=A0A9P6RT76_9FUNG|nr:hypothetical protein BGZ99_003852 [Dissophora globulifera]
MLFSVANRYCHDNALVDFEPLLATVSYIINQHNPDCVFLTTYQDRSAKRNIDQLLRKWNLEGSIIDQEDFGFEVSKFVVGDAEDGDRNEWTTISDSDMDDVDDAGDHIAETAQRKYNESIGIDQTYQIGDGGALSSVHLLFICKQGHGDSLKAWKAKIIV